MTPAPPRSTAGSALAIFWWTILLVPAATVFAPDNAWDVSPIAAMAASVVVLSSMQIALGRWFSLVTWPIAWIGLIATAAGLVRHVNVFEILFAGPALDPDEVRAALAPYAGWCAVVAAVLAAMAVGYARLPKSTAGDFLPRRSVLSVMLALVAVGCAVAAPGAFLRSWPLNIATLAASKLASRADLLSMLLPFAPADPRSPQATWHAKRSATAPSPDQAETYVLIIGESVRSDRLHDCGNPREVQSAVSQILVFCNVTSGSASTHTSVPYLVSRALPGGLTRIGTDATFIKAFEQAGFDTWWISVQEREVAWPDARHSEYLRGRGTDRDRLDAPFRTALASPARKKLIVLHAYNAHFAYCDRYDQPQWPVDCSSLRDLPNPSQRDTLLGAYDNAIQESMRFVDHVVNLVDESSGSGGHAFVVYTSDHGDNVFDDKRELFLHALSEITRWDTRVPALVWASSTWRDSTRPNGRNSQPTGSRR